MYEFFKKIIHKLVPKQTVFKLEPYMRGIWSLLYRGSKFRCTICQVNLRKWIAFHEDSICPNCGSLSRDRRLWELVESNYLTNEMTVLDFSPSRSLYRKWKKQKVNYLTTDLSGDFISDKQYDITSIPESDNRFDLILCYHVLEHVIDDVKAMEELYRIIKPKGILLVQTPYKEGEIYEDYTITAEKERLEHFGQEDHVRIYSVAGLKNRLNTTGFEVTIHQFKGDCNKGLTDNEIVFVLTK